MHDPRLGRFFAVDPLTAKYPHYTPYSFSGNKVIAFIELEGMEELSAITVNKEKWTGTIDLSKTENRSTKEAIEKQTGIKLGANDIVTFDYQGGILANNSYLQTINVSSAGQKTKKHQISVEREEVPVFEGTGRVTVGVQGGFETRLGGEHFGVELNAVNVELGELTVSQRYDSDAPVKFEADYIGKDHRVEVSQSIGLELGIVGYNVERSFEIDTRTGNDYGEEITERYNVGPIMGEEGSEQLNGHTTTSKSFIGVDIGFKGALILGVDVGVKSGKEIITTKTETKNY
ncbi:hypothetical protein [Parvicella tangerina]|uniref:RHS repeat-associated core domain-containing protein n=1 Tax=Parvicella tangerina TaxID=2829795 RepID=A0A916NRH9_9FLAO|nr:hypothetical protein [Parvicella tangerina]CAG5081280.1 hypothetical protein CRYO30217_01581 [Parvicella tangerina]